MTYAEINANDVYKACHKALSERRKSDRHSGDHEKSYERIGQIADFSNFIHKKIGEDAIIHISIEDFLLLNGFF